MCEANAYLLKGEREELVARGLATRPKLTRGVPGPDAELLDGKP